MKKLFSLLLAVFMLTALTATAWAETLPSTSTAKITVNDNRKYAVYQIFTGDLDASTLSNVKWGANGTGTVGTSVAQSVLDALKAVNGKTDLEKLAVIEQYVNLGSAPVKTITKDSTDADRTFAIGYYLLRDVTDSIPDGEEASEFIVKLVGNTTVTAKAGTIVPGKKVQDTNDSTGATDGWKDSADYDIGDDVPFQLSGTISKNYANYTTYYYCFHDTLTAGLTFNPSSVVVKVDGVQITNTNENTYYTVKTTGLSDGCTFKIEFTDLKKIASVTKDSTITVEYTATLNTSAAIGPAGNSNTMHIEYSNNPNSDAHGETTTDKVDVFTYQFKVNKVDETNAPLTGAGFTLYKWVKSGDSGSWVAVGSEVKGENLTTFIWKGLDDGKYKLVETTTPAGCNTMADMEFTITATHDLNSANPSLTGLSCDNSSITVNMASETLTSVLETTIVNYKGTVLPETGATGTMMFIGVGSVLAIAAVVCLVTRKKMSIYQD